MQLVMANYKNWVSGVSVQRFVFRAETQTGNLLFVWISKNCIVDLAWCGSVKDIYLVDCDSLSV